MNIDMQALLKASRGDQQSQISIRKVWVKTVIAMLEQNTSYDTAGLRALVIDNGEPKITVRRQWLAHIYDVLNAIETPPKKKTTIPAAAEKDFDRAFDHLDTAFSYIDRAFGTIGRMGRKY